MPTIILTPEQRIRQRYNWFEEAARVGNITLACRRLGISRKTYHKWRQLYQFAGIDCCTRLRLVSLVRRRSRPSGRSRSTGRSSA
jgi:hypothetical protein